MESVAVELLRVLSVLSLGWIGVRLFVVGEVLEKQKPRQLASPWILPFSFSQIFGYFPLFLSPLLVVSQITSLTFRPRTASCLGASWCRVFAAASTLPD